MLLHHPVALAQQRTQQHELTPPPTIQDDGQLSRFTYTFPAAPPSTSTASESGSAPPSVSTMLPLRHPVALTQQRAQHQELAPPPTIQDGGQMAPPPDISPVASPSTPAASEVRPAPPSAPHLGARPLPAACVSPSTVEQEIYDINDPSVFWMNARPFRPHKSLGKGGFGEVCQVELLIPRGTEVIRTETGHLEMDGAGFATLRLERNLDVHGLSSVPAEPADPAREQLRARAGAVPANADREDPRQLRDEGPLVQEPPVTDSDAGVAEMLSSEILAASMGPPQDLISFVLNGGAADGIEATAAVTTENNILRSIGVNEDLTFNIERTILKPSGAFFALKIQKAKNREKLEELVKEADNMGKLKGCPFIVQIVDHEVIEDSLTLLILMELGACDMGLFLRKCNPLSVADISRVWPALVRAVDAAHAKDIIHRDIKPQNFVLVPATPSAEKVLATIVKESCFNVEVLRERFVFQVADDDVEQSDLLGESGSVAERHRGDVKLFLHDPTTGREEVLRLQLKLSDFGMAQPLEFDKTHLSIKGAFGTILYMAPETLRPTVGTKRISKEVDIWALGVILFQMLHDNMTPFEVYYEEDGRIGVAVAASNKEIHQEAIVFERMKVCVWIAERKKVLVAAGKIDAGACPDNDARKAKTLARGRGLVVAWMQTDFLLRMCQFCLSFDALDRVAVKDLMQWIGVAVASGWWKGEICAADGKPSMDFVEQHIAPRIIGRMITEGALPEVFCRKFGNAVENDADGCGSGGTSAREGHDGANLQPGPEVESGEEVSFRQKVLGIFILVLIIGVGAFVGAKVGSAGTGSETVDKYPNPTTGPPEVVALSSTPAFLPSSSPKPTSPDTAPSPRMLPPWPSSRPIAPTPPSSPVAPHPPPSAVLPYQPSLLPEQPAVSFAASSSSPKQPAVGGAQSGTRTTFLPPIHRVLDRDPVIKEVSKNGAEAFFEKHPSFKADKDVVLAALEGDLRALRIAAPALWNDREVLLKALKRYFQALRPLVFDKLLWVEVEDILGGGYGSLEWMGSEEEVMVPWSRGGDGYGGLTWNTTVSGRLEPAQCVGERTTELYKRRSDNLSEIERKVKRGAREGLWKSGYDVFRVVATTGYHISIATTLPGWHYLLYHHPFPFPVCSVEVGEATVQGWGGQKEFWVYDGEFWLWDESFKLGGEINCLLFGGAGGRFQFRNPDCLSRSSVPPGGNRHS